MDKNTHDLPKTLPKFFWHFLRPYKWYLTGLFCTGLYWAIFTSLSPFLLREIINRIAEFEGAREGAFAAVQGVLIAYMAIWVVVATNFRIRDWINLRMHPSVRKDVIEGMFAYLNKHSFTYFQNNFAGSLSNKISDMTGGIIAIILKVDQFVAEGLGILIAFPVMFYIHPIFATILFVWLVLFIAVSVYFARRVENLSNVFSTSKTTMVGRLVDAVTNISTVRLFARTNYEAGHLQKHIDDTVTKDREMQKYILRMHIGWDLTIVPLICVMIYTLVVMYSKGLVSIGDFAFIISLSISIFHNLWNIMAQYVQFSEDLGKCSQALTIVTAPHDIRDAEDAKPLRVKQGEIQFHDVTFHYNKGANVFENKNVVIDAGQKVGLVGFSGSGKTSFVNLILRFFEVESGKITIDGQNVAEVTQDSLRENISMIPQDTSLFHRSLMENIRYGKLDATDEEVIEASKKAHCHEFIEQLEKGYDTLVGERGIKLSGGQRQRIAIARAMLKDAPILILDEATSALDSVTEKLIQESLAELMQGRTTIVVAHRLSTLSEMDRVLVFDKGQVIEDGSHDELLELNGHYARMWHMQAGGFLPEKE